MKSKNSGEVVSVKVGAKVCLLNMDVFPTYLLGKIFGFLKCNCVCEWGDGSVREVCREWRRCRVDCFILTMCYRCVVTGGRDFGYYVDGRVEEAHITGLALDDWRLERLRGMKRLRELRFWNNLDTCGDLDMLVGIVGLRRLGISDLNCVGEEEWCRLAILRSLEELSLVKCENVTNEIGRAHV